MNKAQNGTNEVSQVQLVILVSGLRYELTLIPLFYLGNLI